MMADDITSGLLADITITMVTLTAGHRHTAPPGSWMTSQNKTITSGLQLTSP